MLRLASAGDSAGLLHAPDEKEDVPITVRLARASRSDLERLKSLKLRGRGGNLVALGEIAHIESAIEDKSIYHKNLMPVTYVTADLAGVIESPVYAMLKVGPRDRANPDSRKVTASSSTRPACRPPTHATRSNGTASGTSPTRSFATSAWRSARC